MSFWSIIACLYKLRTCQTYVVKEELLNKLKNFHGHKDTQTLDALHRGSYKDLIVMRNFYKIILI